MIFDEEFLKSLPEDPHNAILAICNEFDERWGKKDTVLIDLVLESFALISIYSEAINLQIELPDVKDSMGSVQNAYRFIRRLQKQIKPNVLSNQFEQYKNLFATKLGTVFYFEFTEGDLERIQQLINELRKLISKTKELKKEHKQRLLSKLENVQKEFHKTMTNLDRILGAIIETGVALGQFGKDVKPLTDRIGELASIILSAQKRAYGLPSSLKFKLLDKPKDDKSKDDKS